MSTKKILFVDDVNLSLEMGKEAFESTGCEVLTASNGSEALKLVREEHPALVLMDLFMPLMNGDECCRQIKSDEKTMHIPVIMITAVDRKENLDRCFSAGCDDLIIKPFSKEIMLNKAKRYIDIICRGPERVKVNIDAVYEYDGNRSSGRVKNISYGGMFVKTDQLPPSGTNLGLTLSLPEIEKGVKVDGRVIRVEEKRAPGRSPGIGVKFTEISNELEDFISDNMKE